MSTFRSVCLFGSCALLIGCGEDVSEQTSTSESAVSVCAPEGGPPLAQGIDISHYDGTIDWHAVQDSGVTFAFAKATEGTTFTDPTFATNWANMQDAGVVRGAYHFFHPELDPDTQAAFVVSTVGPLAPTDLPIVIDLETSGSEPEATIIANALTFLDDVETATGRTPIVYSSNRVFTQVIDGTSPKFARYPLWDAQYSVACPTIPDPWTTWAFWQTNDNGTIPGISGIANVDVDTFNGTVADFNVFVTGAPDAGPITNDGGTSIDSGLPIAEDSGASQDGSLNESPDGASDSGGCACSLDRESRSASPSWLWLGALACLIRRKNKRISRT